jgi:NAD(P)-dependent dehydrogenase (short-subunit alcohol dehydrogenase family)
VLLTSPFLLAKHAWPALLASGDGRIVVVAFVHGLVASPYKVGYVAAKHGVLGLVKSLALEGAEARIGVSAVCPGYVRTPLVESQIAAQAEAHAVAPERVRRRRPSSSAGDQAAPGAGRCRGSSRIPPRAGRPVRDGLATHPRRWLDCSVTEIACATRRRGPEPCVRAAFGASEPRARSVAEK